MESIVVAALYQFKAVADPANLQQSLKDLCKTQEILGTLIVANEGINGTVSGSRQKAAGDRRVRLSHRR